MNQPFQPKPIRPAFVTPARRRSLDALFEGMSNGFRLYLLGGLAIIASGAYVWALNVAGNYANDLGATLPW